MSAARQSAIPVITVDVPYQSRSDTFRLWLLCDAHLGNRYAREDEVKGVVERIAGDRLALWLDGGDKAECITHKDKRFEPEDLADWIPARDLNRLPSLQAARYAALMQPIKGKCLGLIEGNHEQMIRRQYQYPLHGTVCEKLGVRDLGLGAAWLRLRFKRSTGGKDVRVLNVVVTHGSGTSARSKSCKALRLDNALHVYNADLVMLAHLHDRRREVAMDWIESAGRVIPRKRVAVCGGTFLETASYSIERMYPPAEVGAVCVEYTPNTGLTEVRL